MASNKDRITLQDALRGRFEKSRKQSEEAATELVSDVKALFGSLEGRELVVALIERIQQDAAERVGLPVDADFHTITVNDLDGIRDVVRDGLQQFISFFILDEHRKFIVRCHARGISTTAAVTDLISEDDVMNRLAYEDALGLRQLRDILVHRMSYLKPGSARWPEAKYGAIWNEARAAHKQLVRDIPLTSPVEQAALLSKHAGRINETLENENHTVKDLQILTNSLTKTIESLKKVSAVESQTSTDLSAPQLVAVLERLTLALDTPEQPALTGDTNVLVGVLEQLTLALKSSDHTAISGEVENVPADTDTEDGDSE